MANEDEVILNETAFCSNVADEFGDLINNLGPDKLYMKTPRRASINNPKI